MTSPASRPRNESRIVRIWPRMIRREPRGSSFFASVDDALRPIAATRAEVRPVHAAVDVDDGLRVEVRDGGRLRRRARSSRGWPGSAAAARPVAVIGMASRSESESRRYCGDWTATV